jgi:hypothetical protein
MGNSWQSPVPAEPSLGTLHHFPLTNTTARLVLNGTALSAGWSAAIDCSSYFPVGAKAALIDFNISGAATGTGSAVIIVHFSDNNSSTPTIGTSHPRIAINDYLVAGVQSSMECELVVPLSSALAFYYYVLQLTNVTTPVISATLKGYMS